MAGETDKPVENLKADVADTTQTSDTAPATKFLADALAQFKPGTDVTATANQIVGNLERSGLLPYVALARMQNVDGSVDLNAFRAKTTDQVTAPGVDVAADPKKAFEKALDKALLAALDKDPSLLANLRAKGRGDVFQSGDVSAQLKAFRDSAAQRVRADGATDPKLKIAAALLDNVPGTNRSVIDALGGTIRKSTLDMALDASNPNKLSPEQLSALKTLQQNWNGTNGVSDLGYGNRINKQSLAKAVGADSPEAAARKLKTIVPDLQYQETKTASGVVRTFNDGRTVTVGTDGKLTTVYGETWKGDQRLKGAKVEVFPAGTGEQIRNLFPNKAMLAGKETFPDGATVITRTVNDKPEYEIITPEESEGNFPGAKTVIRNGEATTTFKDGSVRTIKPDGTTVRKLSNDVISVTKADGTGISTVYTLGPEGANGERPVTKYEVRPKPSDVENGIPSKVYTAETVGGVTKFKGPDDKGGENLRMRPDGTLLFRQNNTDYMVPPTKDGTPVPATSDGVVGSWKPDGQNSVLTRADNSTLTLGRVSGQLDTVTLTDADKKVTDAFKYDPKERTWSRTSPADRKGKVDLTVNETTGALTVREPIGDNTVATNIKPDGTRVVTEVTNKDGRSLKFDPAQGTLDVTIPGKTPERYTRQPDNTWKNSAGNVFKSVTLEATGRLTTVDNNGLKTELTPKGVQRPLEATLPNNGGTVKYTYTDDSASVPKLAERTFIESEKTVKETLTQVGQNAWDRTRDDQPGQRERVKDLAVGDKGNLIYRDRTGDRRAWGDANLSSQPAPAIVGKAEITRMDGRADSPITKIVNGDRSTTLIGYPRATGGELPRYDTIARTGPNGENLGSFTRTGENWKLNLPGQPPRDVMNVNVDQKTGNITYDDGRLSRAINTNGQDQVVGIKYPNDTVAKVQYDARGVAQTLTLTDKSGKSTVYRGNDFKMEPSTGIFTNSKTGERISPDGQVTTPEGTIKDLDGKVLGYRAPGRQVTLKSDGTLSTVNATINGETTTIMQNEKNQWVLKRGTTPERLINDPKVDAAGNVTWNEGGKPYTMKQDGTIVDGTVAAVKPDGPAVAIPGIDKSGIGKYGPHGVAEAVLGRQTTADGQYAINELKNILRDANGGTKAIMGLKAGTPLINEANKGNVIAALRASLARKANPQLQALLNQLGG